MNATQHFSVMQLVQRWQQRTRIALPVVDLLMRAYVAKIFFMSGLTKLRDWEMTVSLFTDEYQVPFFAPETAAYLATGAELLLPVLLMLGLFRTFTAFALIAVNVLAVVSYYHVLHDMPAALQDHLEWGLMLLVIASLPSNRLQLDHFLGRQQSAA